MVPGGRLSPNALSSSASGAVGAASYDHLVTSKRPLYGLDIETDTTVDGLDASVAPIVAVALATESGTEVIDHSEADILRELNRRLNSLPPGIIVTWNGGRFDLPFIAERARLLGVDLDLRLEPDPFETVRPESDRSRGWLAEWGRHSHLDGYRVYRADVGRALPVSCGLKPMARFVGMVPVEVDRENVHVLSPDELADYVSSDAVMARLLVDRRGVAIEAHVDRLPSRFT